MTLRRALLLHASDELYGADRIFFHVASTLRRAGIEVTAVLPADIEGERPLSSRLTASGCDVRRLRLAVLRRRYMRAHRLPAFTSEWVGAVLRVRRLIRQVRPDVVYTNTLAVTAGAAAARSCGLPHVWHIHEIITSPRWLGRGLGAAAWRLSTRVVAASDAVAAFLHDGSPRSSAVVVHYAIDDPLEGIDRAAARLRVEREFGLEPDTPLVLMVGRLSGWKGAFEFARIAADHIRSGGTAHFAILGGAVPGETELRDRIAALVADPENRGALHWLDFTMDVPVYLARASMFVLPSLQPDPFPTVVLEAMYAGLPIVAFAHGGVLEMIRPGTAGIEVPVADVAGMRGAIEDLIQCPARRLELGARARAHALHAFSPRRFEARMLEEIRGACNGA